MKQIVIIFGSVGGMVLLLMIVITNMFWGSGIDFDNGELIGYSSMVIALSTVFIGIKTYRDRELGGSISFGQGFKVGMLITLVASVFYVATWMIYLNVGEKSNFMEEYTKHVIEEMRESGASEEEIQEQREDMAEMAENYKNPLVQIAFTFMEILPVGLIISLLSAGILRQTGTASVSD